MIQFHRNVENRCVPEGNTNIKAVLANGVERYTERSYFSSGNPGAP